jgi:hypothetical protein
LTPAHLTSNTTHVKAHFDGPKIKCGDRVTLEDDDRICDVVEVWPEHSATFIHRSWSNNI